MVVDIGKQLDNTYAQPTTMNKDEAFKKFQDEMSATFAKPDISKPIINDDRRRIVVPSKKEPKSYEPKPKYGMPKRSK